MLGIELRVYNVLDPLPHTRQTHTLKCALSYCTTVVVGGFVISQVWNTFYLFAGKTYDETVFEFIPLTFLLIRRIKIYVYYLIVFLFNYSIYFIRINTLKILHLCMNLSLSKLTNLVDNFWMQKRMYVHTSMYMACRH
jgi:hypothetical protein